MSARHYSSKIGRFLEPDPSAREPNLYGYVSNSPVTRIDPLGLDDWWRQRIYVERHKVPWWYEGANAVAW